MRLEVDIDSSRQLARIRILGPFEPSQFLAAAKEFLAHPEFTPGMPAIYDLRGADLKLVTAEDLKFICCLWR